MDEIMMDDQSAPAAPMTPAASSTPTDMSAIAQTMPVAPTADMVAPKGMPRTNEALAMLGAGQPFMNRYS